MSDAHTAGPERPASPADPQARCICNRACPIHPDVGWYTRRAVEDLARLKATDTYNQSSQELAAASPRAALMTYRVPAHVITSCRTVGECEVYLAADVAEERELWEQRWKRVVQLEAALEAMTKERDEAYDESTRRGAALIGRERELVALRAELEAVRTERDAFIDLARRLSDKLEVRQGDWEVELPIFAELRAALAAREET